MMLTIPQNMSRIVRIALAATAAGAALFYFQLPGRSLSSLVPASFGKPKAPTAPEQTGAQVPAPAQIPAQPQGLVQPAQAEAPMQAVPVAPPASWATHCLIVGANSQWVGPSRLRVYVQTRNLGQPGRLFVEANVGLLKLIQAVDAEPVTDYTVAFDFDLVPGEAFFAPQVTCTPV